MQQAQTNCNPDNGWYLITDIVTLYDWKGASADKLTLPDGGGNGRLLKAGYQAMIARGEACLQCRAPESGARVRRPKQALKWNVGFTIQGQFPK